MYNVELYCSFEADSPQAAVRHMIAWAQQEAQFASYIVTDDDGQQFAIDANDLDQTDGYSGLLEEEYSTDEQR